MEGSRRVWVRRDGSGQSRPATRFFAASDADAGSETLFEMIRWTMSAMSSLLKGDRPWVRLGLGLGLGLELG